MLFRPKIKHQREPGLMIPKNKIVWQLGPIYTQDTDAAIKAAKSLRLKQLVSWERKIGIITGRIVEIRPTGSLIIEETRTTAADDQYYWSLPANEITLL